MELLSNSKGNILDDEELITTLANSKAFGGTSRHECKSRSATGTAHLCGKPERSRSHWQVTSTRIEERVKEQEKTQDWRILAML